MIVRCNEAPDVVALITTLGANSERLKHCVDSVLQSSFGGRLASVVVCNDPRQEIGDLGQVEILIPGLNLGFPGGLNFGRQSSTAPFLWIVQDDMTVDATCLQSLMDRMNAIDQPAIVSPVSINEHGLVPAISRGGVVGDGAVMDHWYPFTDCLPSEIDLTHTLNWVSLGGALIRTEVWDEVGGMDPSFFPLLWSDVDFGYRVTRTGRRVVIEPSAVMTHERHGSTPSLLLHFTLGRNQERFRRKHHVERAPVNPTKQLDLSTVVGYEASLFVLDLATHAETVRRTLQDKIDELEAALVAERNAHFVAQREADRACLQVEQLEVVVNELHVEASNLQAVNEALHERNSHLLNSRSMQVTKPLRAIGSLLRKMRQR